MVTNDRQPMIANCSLDAFEMSSLCLVKLGNTALLNFASNLKNCFCIRQKY